MLQSLRASAQGWFGRAIMAVVMGFIILSFVIWGIGDIFRGFGANDLARVGKIEIGAETFRNAYQTELQRQQRLERRNITSEEAHENGMDRQVLSRLVADAALDDQAMTLGLAINDEDIKKAIMADENFKGMTGTFDRQMLAAYLREEGLTEKGYIQNQRAVYLRRQIIDSMTAGVQLPKALLEAIFRFQMEGRGVDYVVLPFAKAGQLPPPAVKELQQFYDSNRVLYAIPEYRSLVTLEITPESIAKPDGVSDCDAGTVTHADDCCARHSNSVFAHGGYGRGQRYRQRSVWARHRFPAHREYHQRSALPGVAAAYPFPLAGDRLLRCRQRARLGV